LKVFRPASVTAWKDCGRILADGLKRFDLDEAFLQKTAKGEWSKVASD
jgi:hypothetical protein